MIDFSVLMSVYKKENPSYMRDSLNSVFNQTLQPTEVVLVEDGPLTQELYDLVSDFVKHHSLLL